MAMDEDADNMVGASYLYLRAVVWSNVSSLQDRHIVYWRHRLPCSADSSVSSEDIRLVQPRRSMVNGPESRANTRTTLHGPSNMDGGSFTHGNKGALSHQQYSWRLATVPTTLYSYGIHHSVHSVCPEWICSSAMYLSHTLCSHTAILSTLQPYDTYILRP